MNDDPQPIHKRPTSNIPAVLALGRSEFIGSIVEHNCDLYWDRVDNSTCAVMGQTYYDVKWYVYEDGRIREYRERKTDRVTPTRLLLDLECSIIQMLADKGLLLECTGDIER